VPEMPGRPFVPRRTPKSSRQLDSTPEFRLSRPFVAGSARHAAAPSREFTESYGVTVRSQALPGIAEFLDTSARQADVVATQSLANYSSELADNGDELPPVEHFLDPLPDVDAFAPDVEGALADGPTDEFPSNGGAGGEQGWVEDAWQRYDWNGAAALGDGPETEASNEWATTDWDSGAPAARTRTTSPADAIASALDQIARRIREGEFAVGSPEALADPTTIAATLAALLGVRR
jgi:hypothetical protein